MLFFLFLLSVTEVVLTRGGYERSFNAAQIYESE